MRFAAAAALYLALASAAHAAVFYVPDLGVRALGRGGAFVAKADDLTAAWYNPAGLADQGGTRFHGDAGFIRQSVFYQRTDEQGGGSFSPVGNTAAPFVIPFLGVSSDFGLRTLTFSASVYGPYASTYNYPPAGPQRYTLIESGVLEAIFQVSVGWRIFPWLRVGASVQNVDTRARQKLAIAALVGNEGESDAKVDVDVADHFTPNFHLGLLVSPAPWLDFGVGLKPPMPVHANGTLTVDQGDIERLRATQPALRNLAVRGNQVAVDFELPLVLRAGLRFKQPRWDVEADFVWERWNGFSRLKVVPKDIVYTLSGDPTPLAPIEQERNYGSAYSFRLGSDVEILPGRLTGRLGYYYETSAVPTRSLNVSVVDMAKHGFSVGLSAKFGWFGVSAAYAHVELAETRVFASSSEQINLTLQQFNQPAPSVGSGLYRSGYEMFALGISVDIDTLAGWQRRR